MKCWNISTFLESLDFVTLSNLQLKRSSCCLSTKKGNLIVCVRKTPAAASKFEKRKRLLKCETLKNFGGSHRGVVPFRKLPLEGMKTS